MRFPWSLLARRRPPTPLLQLPFIGQQALLEALDERLQDAQRGTAAYLTLAGPSGSGTSTLLEEWCFAQRQHSAVLFLQLNAADCLLPYTWYQQLCHGLRTQSEQIIHTVYTATARVRKTLSLQWDATEFRHIVASTDWAEEGATPPRPASASGQAVHVLAPLFRRVQEHPWALGAAALLDISDRSVSGRTAQQVWEQRWRMALRTLRARVADGAVLVLLIDHLTSGRRGEAPIDANVAAAWQTFVTITAAERLPCVILWAGTAAELQPVHQALHDERYAATSQAYALGALDAEEKQQLTRRAVRALPRALQPVWSAALASGAAATATPAWLILATTCAAVMGERADTASVSALAQLDMTALVRHLTDDIRQRHPAQAPLFGQLLEVCAFMPPGKQVEVDDFLPWCDFAGPEHDPAAGRTHLETLLGQCVRAGLLRYDPYSTRYTLGSHAIQEALQAVLYPDALARWQMARQRRLAAAMLQQLQRSDRMGLAALAQYMEETHGAAARALFTSLVVVPFQRLLPMCPRAERQRMAHALGGFPTALAVDLLRLLVHDEDGQVRSSAVQGLADLAREESVPVLLEALRDRNSDVRWIAARALGQHSSSTAVDALIPLLTDEDREVGRIAAEGLGQQGDRRAVPHLIAAIQEGYPRLRESAIVALGELADRRAIPALHDVVHDMHPQVRRSAEAALARLAASTGS